MIRAIVAATLVLSGCAGSELALGVGYAFRDGKTTAESQFFPSARAEVEEKDTQSIWIEYRMFLTPRDIRIVEQPDPWNESNIDRLSDAVEQVSIEARTSSSPNVHVSTGGNEKTTIGKVNVPGIGGVDKDTDPFLILALSVMAVALAIAAGILWWIKKQKPKGAPGA